MRQAQPDHSDLLRMRNLEPDTATSSGLARVKGAPGRVLAE